MHSGFKNGDKKKALTIVLIILLLCSAVGCLKPSDSGSAPTEAPGETAAQTAWPTSETTPSPEPGPTQEPIVRDALKTAEDHGLSEDDLRGEYELFLRFSETIESNSELGEYRELVYRIFPVIADHKMYIDPEFFLGRLASLSFAKSHHSDSC